MSQINFKYIPQNMRVPLFYAEVDNSQANTATAVQRTLIIGQKTTAGTGAQDTVNICSGSNDAATLAGVNSRLAADVAAYRQNDASGELWIGLLADDGGGTAATGTLTFGGAATANGSFFFYLGGVRYVLPVLTTQSATQLATALVALVNADLTCPFTASSAAAVVTFTADSKGPQGNDYPMAVSFYGLPSEPTVPGLTATLVQMSAGATVPSLTNLLVAMGDQTFDCIVCPYNDTTTLDTLKTFLNDATGRWAYSQAIYGHVFTAKSGTLSALVTFGTARNDQHATCFGVPPGSPTPVSAWAAGAAASSMASLRIDPARPLATLVVSGVIAPPLTNRFVLLDRNTLLYNGISTLNVADDGTVALEQVITTYQKNGFGSPDDSYLKIQTLFNLMFQLRFMAARVSSKFARVKLADDGTPAGPGSNIVTPKLIRAEEISAYGDLVKLGLAQDADVFAANVVVQRNALNPNRADTLFPTILIDQLDVLALLAQFRLQA